MRCFKTHDAKELIIECQHKPYNIGAPKVEQVIEYLKTKGFEMVEIIDQQEVDGDYYFKKI